MLYNKYIIFSMRLLRLTTNDNNGFIDCDFGEDIILQPNTKIALNSISIEQNPRKIIIDDSNDTITFGMTSGQALTAVLTHNTYNNDTYQDLIDDIKRALNSALNYDGFQIGLQWNCQINSDKRFVLEYKKAKPYRFDVSNTYNIIKNITDDGTNYVKTDTTKTDYDSFLGQTNPFTKGCGSTYFRIGNTTTLADDWEAIIGLTEKKPSSSITYSLSDIIHGVSIKNTGVDSILSGSLFDTGHIPSPFNTDQKKNETYALILEEGQIKIKVFKSETDIILNNDSFDFDYSKNYYPVIFIRKGGIKLIKNRVFMSYDIFYNGKTNVDDSITNEDLEAIIPNPSRSDSKYNYITLPPSLENYFDIESIPNTSPLTSVKDSITYEAYADFKGLVIIDSVLIELLDIQLQSYDSFSGKRQNILSVIPNIQQIKDKLIYSANFPVFIGLNNPNKTSIRNIRARILDTDYSKLDLRGESVITILLQD